MYDCTQPETRDEGITAAASALSAGQLVVLPTDTVYGIGAAAFDPGAVADLLAAKGRGRQSPPPVLVPAAATVAGLATDVPDTVHTLLETFWPGPLTVICRAQPTLAWDLGDTGGTVALRMPDDEIALALLTRTGPLAVSSANRHGRPAATTVLEAATALGDRVAVYLDGGPSRGGVASTIVDATGPTLRIVRAGALSLDELTAVVPETADVERPADDGPKDGAVGP
ncbi:L-threonylcarbamoyladenylate synthase [Georgenia phoenicis]